MGHLRQLQSGTCSTTSSSKRGQTVQALHLLERDAASDDALELPTQEANNEKTLNVYMTVKLADGWIASNQTGVFSTVSSRGNTYTCVFYIHDLNFIKGLQSSHNIDQLSLAHTNWCTNGTNVEDSSPRSKEWTMKRQKTSRILLRSSTHAFNILPQDAIARPQNEQY